MEGDGEAATGRSSARPADEKTSKKQKVSEMARRIRLLFQYRLTSTLPFISNNKLISGEYRDAAMALRSFANTSQSCVLIATLCEI
jgi:hypothetical protein